MYLATYLALDENFLTAADLLVSKSNKLWMHILFVCAQLEVPFELFSLIVF
jgi:hypothetical protein